MLKLDNLGTIEWKRIVGVTGTDVVYALFQTHDGGYFLGGYSSSNDYDVSGNHGGNYDGWAVKLSNTGNIEWQKTLGGSGWDDLWGAKQTADHGYILAGESTSNDGDATGNHGTFDFWVIKLDESGNVEWSKLYGGSGDDSGVAVIQTADGGYIAVGETASTDGQVTGLNGNIDFWVIKLSADGTLEWQNTYGGNGWDTASGVLQSADGGYVVLGYSGSNTGDVTGHYGSFDFWVIKIDSVGNLEWEKSLGGTNPDWARGIVPAVGGGYFLIGETQSMNGDVVGNTGGMQLWLVKISETGSLIWQKTYGGTLADGGFALDNTRDNGLILAGWAWSTDGDLIGSLNRGYNDYWVVKLAPESVSSAFEPNANPAHIDIYPNPASQAISIRVATEIQAIKVSVSDMLGRELLQQEIPNGGQLEVATLPSGMYLLHAIAADGKVFRGKFQKG